MPPDPDARSPAEHRVDDLLADLRHNLRTPLTVISGQAQLARRRVRRIECPEGAYLLARLAAIESAVLAMGEQIERLGHDLFPDDAADPRRDEEGAS